MFKLSFSFSGLKWNKLFLDLALLASHRLTLRHVFSARFPGVVLLGWEDLFPIHFQRLITGKLPGVDPFRPRNLQRGRVESLIHAFISSKLVYCISPLHGIPKYLVSRLQRVQNTAVRIVMLTRKYDSITPIVFKLLWLPIHSRIIFKLLLLVYKALNGKAPS